MKQVSSLQSILGSSAGFMFQKPFLPYVPAFPTDHCKPSSLNLTDPSSQASFPHSKNPSLAMVHLYALPFNIRWRPPWCPDFSSSDWNLLLLGNLSTSLVQHSQKKELINTTCMVVPHLLVTGCDILSRTRSSLRVKMDVLALRQSWQTSDKQTENLGLLSWGNKFSTPFLDLLVSHYCIPQLTQYCFLPAFNSLPS